METKTGKVRAIANLGRPMTVLIMKQQIMLLPGIPRTDRL
jgi:hypothetical protein